MRMRRLGTSGLKVSEVGLGPDQVKTNAAAGHWRLTPEDVADVSALIS